MTAKKVTAGNNLLPHPIADSCPGEMDADEFNALKQDLKKNGQQQNIVLFEGKILDGRSRYKALNQLEKMPRTEVFKGSATEAEQYVLSVNLQRRTLTSMQKAIVAARQCRREKDPLNQKDAAAMVGCSLQSVNLAVRLLAKNNTPLIKRAERGEATRGEIEELLYESGSIQQNPTRVPTGAAAEQEAEDDELEDMIGDVDDKGKGKKGKGADVIKLDDHRPVPATGGKRSRAGRVAHETSASRVVRDFKALKEEERKHFVDMAWSWLEPAIQAAGRSVVPRVKMSKKAAAEALVKHAAEDKKVAKAKKAAQVKAAEAAKGKRRVA